MAKKRELLNTEFLAMDAADLSHFADASQDLVVVFGILHHIPKWREVVRECLRVLRPGGRLFLEEPTVKAITIWDSIFHWDHPKEALSFSAQSLRAARQWLFTSPS